jgi:hypothetical protein
LPFFQKCITENASSFAKMIFDDHSRLPGGTTMLLKKKRLIDGQSHYIFVLKEDGHVGQADTGVTLIGDPRDFIAWPHGSDRPSPCLGQDPDDEKIYKIFHSDAELRQQGFRFVSPRLPSLKDTWAA